MRVVSAQQTVLYALLAVALDVAKPSVALLVTDDAYRGVQPCHVFLWIVGPILRVSHRDHRREPRGTAVDRGSGEHRQTYSGDVVLDVELMRESLTVVVREIRPDVDRV